MKKIHVLVLIGGLALVACYMLSGPRSVPKHLRSPILSPDGNLQVISGSGRPSLGNSGDFGGVPTTYWITLCLPIGVHNTLAISDRQWGKQQVLWLPDSTGYFLDVGTGHAIFVDLSPMDIPAMLQTPDHDLSFSDIKPRRISFRYPAEERLLLNEAIVLLEELPSLLLTQLTKGDTAARVEAVSGLRDLGPAARGSVPALVSVLEDRNVRRSLRRTAAEALGEIGEDAETAVPALVSVLEDRNVRRSLRATAAEALGKIGKDAKAAVPALIRALSDDEICRDVAKALGKIGPGAAQAIPALENKLTVVPGFEIADLKKAILLIKGDK